jgi:hypothetical protein
MRNSIIAAAFAAALPIGAMAQDYQAPQQPQEAPDEMCTPVSLTEEFCVALQDGNAQIMVIETPEGNVLGMPGVKIDEAGNQTPCIGIVDRQLNLRGLACQETEQNAPAEQPEFAVPN